MILAFESGSYMVPQLQYTVSSNLSTPGSLLIASYDVFFRITHWFSRQLRQPASRLTCEWSHAPRYLDPEAGWPANLKEGCIEPSSDETFCFGSIYRPVSLLLVSSHHNRQFTELISWALDWAGPGCAGACTPLTLVAWLHHGNTIWACSFIQQNG